jgi:DUF3108-like
VGAKWTYRTGDREETFVVTGVKEKEKDGTRVVSVGRVIDGRLAPAKEVKLTGEGVFVVAEGGKERDTPLPLLELPAKPGDKWEVDARGPGNVPVKWRRAVGGPEKVKVPAGTFEAIRVEHTYTVPGTDGRPDVVVLTLTEWFAHGVGLVRKASGDKEVGVLKSFTPVPIVPLPARLQVRVADGGEVSAKAGKLRVELKFTNDTDRELLIDRGDLQGFLLDADGGQVRFALSRQLKSEKVPLRKGETTITEELGLDPNKVQVGKTYHLVYVIQDVAGMGTVTIKD